jgi:hypothetical protein
VVTYAIWGSTWVEAPVVPIFQIPPFLRAPDVPAALAKLDATRRLAPVTSIATESHSRLCMLLLSENSEPGLP